MINTYEALEELRGKVSPVRINVLEDKIDDLVYDYLELLEGKDIWYQFISNSKLEIFNTRDEIEVGLESKLADAIRREVKRNI